MSRFDKTYKLEGMFLCLFGRIWFYDAMTKDWGIFWKISWHVFKKHYEFIVIFFAWLQVAVPQYSTQGVTIRLAHFSFEWWKTSYLKSFYGIGGPIIHFIVPEECQRSTLSYSKVKNANDDKFFHKWLDAATILKCSIIWLKAGASYR